jgi:hypothetical protein
MTDITPSAADSARSTPALESRPWLRATRWECQHCGVHTFPVLRHTVVPRCHNCGSEELFELTPIPARC